jgi:hypothetical protein
MMEEAGIATVIIASGVFRDRLAAMRLPRTVITQHPFGRPLGAPGNRERQRQVILAALDLLQSAQQGGIIKDLGGDYQFD